MGPVSWRQILTKLSDIGRIEMTDLGFENSYAPFKDVWERFSETYSQAHCFTTKVSQIHEVYSTLTTLVQDERVMSPWVLFVPHKSTMSLKSGQPGVVFMFSRHSDAVMFRLLYPHEDITEDIAG